MKMVKSLITTRFRTFRMIGSSLCLGSCFSKGIKPPSNNSQEVPAKHLFPKVHKNFWSKTCRQDYVLLMAWCLHPWEWNHLPKISPPTLQLHPINTGIQGNKNHNIHRRCNPRIPELPTLQSTGLGILDSYHDCSWIQWRHCSCPNGEYFHSWWIVAFVCF